MTAAVRASLQFRIVVTVVMSLLLGVVGAAILLGTTADAPAPITTGTLERAARLAQADQFGYDYACAVFQAPRQLRCDGQGPSVLFLVDGAGVPRLEPRQE